MAVTRIGSNRDSPDESATNASQGVMQIVKNIFGGGTRMQDTLLAVAIVVIIFQAVCLYTNYKDMRTQEWLKNDALDKFITGSYADTKAHVIALELNCKKEH